MTEDSLFDEYDFEATDLTCSGLSVEKIPVRKAGESRMHVPSTTETRERYAFLKTKRSGSTWEENDRLYRQGGCGVTVFSLDRLGAKPPAGDWQDQEVARMASKLLSQITQRNQPQ